MLEDIGISGLRVCLVGSGPEGFHCLGKIFLPKRRTAWLHLNSLGTRFKPMQNSVLCNCLYHSQKASCALSFMALQTAVFVSSGGKIFPTSLSRLYIPYFRDLKPAHHNESSFLSAVNVNAVQICRRILV